MQVEEEAESPAAGTGSPGRTDWWEGSGVICCGAAARMTRQQRKRKYVQPSVT